LHWKVGLPPSNEASRVSSDAHSGRGQRGVAEMIRGGAPGAFGVTGRKWSVGFFAIAG
jgi:hypothetical protein